MRCGQLSRVLASVSDDWAARDDPGKQEAEHGGGRVSFGAPPSAYGGERGAWGCLRGGRRCKRWGRRTIKLRWELKPTLGLGLCFSPSSSSLSSSSSSPRGRSSWTMGGIMYGQIDRPPLLLPRPSRSLFSRTLLSAILLCSVQYVCMYMHLQPACSLLQSAALCRGGWAPRAEWPSCLRSSDPLRSRPSSLSSPSPPSPSSPLPRRRAARRFNCGLAPHPLRHQQTNMPSSRHRSQKSRMCRRPLVNRQPACRAAEAAMQHNKNDACPSACPPARPPALPFSSTSSSWPAAPIQHAAAPVPRAKGRRDAVGPR